MVARTLVSALLAGSALGVAVSHDKRDSGYVLVGFDDIKGQAGVNYSAVGANHHYLDYSNFLLGTKGNNIPPRSGMFKLNPETAPNVAAFGQAAVDSKVASSLTSVISITTASNPAPIAAFEIISFGAACYRGQLTNLTAPSKHLKPDDCSFNMTFVPQSGGAPVVHKYAAKGAAAKQWDNLEIGKNFQTPLKQITFSAPVNRTIVIDNLLFKLIKPAKNATTTTTPSTPSISTPSASVDAGASGSAGASTPSGDASASGSASGSASTSPS